MNNGENFIKERLKNLKEDYRDKIADETIKMFYQGFEIDAVKSRIKGKYPEFSVADINDIVDKTFKNMSKKESYKEKLKRLKEDYKIGDIVEIVKGVNKGDTAVIVNKIDTQFYKVKFTDDNNSWDEIHKDSLKLKESYKEKLTLDDVALKKFGKRYNQLTSDEKKECNYIYSEWSDDDYDEGYKKESFKVGDKFSDNHGDWVVIGFAGSKNDMYEIRGSSGSKVVDEDTLKRFYTKKESYKEKLQRLKEGNESIIIIDGRRVPVTIHRDGKHATAQLSDSKFVKQDDGTWKLEESFKEADELPSHCPKCYNPFSNRTGYKIRINYPDSYHAPYEGIVCDNCLNKAKRDFGNNLKVLKTIKRKDIWESYEGELTDDDIISKVKQPELLLALDIPKGLNITKNDNLIRAKLKTLTPEERRKLLKYFNLKESHKEASQNITTKDGKKISLEVSGSGTKGKDMETGEDYEKVNNEWKKKLEMLKEKFEADDKYKNMSLDEAKKILGNVDKNDVQGIKKALSMMRALNTEDEEKRLAAARVWLKNKK